MRGSMLAVVAIAIVAGLGAVFAVRALGLLSPPPVVTPPAAEPAPPAPPPVPTVLVATRVLYSTDAIGPADVRVRPLRPEELKDYEANRDAYMYPSPEVTFFRQPTQDILPDRPIKKADIAAPKKPEALHDRLCPGTRAVALGVSKERSVGGLVQVGDWVDVYLIADVSRPDYPAPVSRTGLLVPHAQVIAKRDTLYPIYAPLPAGAPIPFTLATNPYRAALLEYGKSVGTFAIVPVAADEKKRLDKLRDEAMKDASLVPALTFAPVGTTEYDAEVARIEQYSSGLLGVGPEELSRVLQLPPLVLPPTIELFNGVSRTGVIGPSGLPPRYQFHTPGGPGTSDGQTPPRTKRD